MPFVIPRVAVARFEIGQVEHHVYLDAKPSAEDVKKYIEWLKSEIAVAEAALAELSPVEVVTG